MKRTIRNIALPFALLFTLTSCEGFDWGGLLGDTELLGHVRLVASDAGEGQYYADGDTISFMSTICNVNSESIDITIDTLDVTVDTSLDVNPGTLFVGTEQNLLTGDVANITFPFIGINLNDTIEQTYTIDCPLDNIDLWNLLDTADIASALTSAPNAQNPFNNLFVIVLSETEYYIAYSGSIEITDFQDLNGLVKGNINVQAAYLTNSMIDELGEMSPIELANIDVDTYFRTITFTGEVSSRRTDITEVIESLTAMSCEL